MKNLLTILAVLIILLAVLSIYVNRTRTETTVRIINLIQDTDNVIISINDYTLPYSLFYGTGSEYLHISHDSRVEEFDISVNYQALNSLQNIVLSPDSLNTIVLITKGEKIDYYRTTTPFGKKEDKTGLRWLSNPFFNSDISISLKKAEDRLPGSLLSDNDNNYQYLDQGFYTVVVVFDSQEYPYRVFLENGELYSLVLLAGDIGERYRIRLFIDNAPGDQYITPSKQSKL